MTQGCPPGPAQFPDLLWCSLRPHSLPFPNVHTISTPTQQYQSSIELYLQNAQRYRTSAHYHRTSAHCHRTGVHRHSTLHRTADLLSHIAVVPRCLHLPTHSEAIFFFCSLSIYIILRTTCCSLANVKQQDSSTDLFLLILFIVANAASSTNWFLAQILAL